MQCRKLNEKEGIMKACAATGRKKTYECKEVPTPSIEPGMLLLETIYAGINNPLERLYGALETGKLALETAPIGQEQRFGIKHR